MCSGLLQDCTESDGLQAHGISVSVKDFLFDIDIDEEPLGAERFADLDLQPELDDIDWDGIEYAATQNCQLLINSEGS